MNLFNYQKYAVEKYKDKSVIPLFLRMGAGKSITSTAIACQKFRQGEIDALFIVAPNGVDKQWATRELPLYFTECDEIKEVTASIYFNKKDKKEIPFYCGVLNIAVVNIDVFSTVSSYERYVRWCNAHKTMIIIDEATRIKNPKAKRTERLLYKFNNVVKRGRAILKSEPLTVARCILTGTPVTNGPFDLWSMYEFLKPNYFGMNYYQFQSRYTMFRKLDINGRMIDIPVDKKTWSVIHACNTFEQANVLFGVTMDTYDTIRQQVQYEGPTKHIEELRQVLTRDAMFIRTEDVIDMPATNYIKRYVTMTPTQRKAYEDMESELTVFISAAGEHLVATSKLVRDLRLQQICSGFVSLYNTSEHVRTFMPEYPIEWGLPTQELAEKCGYSEDIYNDWLDSFLQYMMDPPTVVWIEEGKTPKLASIENDLEELSGEQVIIITHFTAEADMLFEALSKEHSCMLVTGQRKVGTIDEFQRGEYDILIANIKCLSMGFNLQNAHYMMFYSNTFSYEDRDQVTKRIHRIGQTKTCNYIDYMCEDSIEERILNEVLAGKQRVAESIMNPSAEETLEEVRKWDS